MGNVENRIAFGTAILERLRAESLSASEEAASFGRSHEALIALDRDGGEGAQGASENEPTELLHAWDAALRRLHDRVHALAPGRVPFVFAPASRAVGSSPERRVTSTKSAARKASRDDRAVGPNATKRKADVVTKPPSPRRGQGGEQHKEKKTENPAPAAKKARARAASAKSKKRAKKA